MTVETLEVVVALPKGAAAARASTRAVRQLLIEAGAYGLLHDATLAVTELVTNTVRRSAGECRLAACYRSAQCRLRVEVSDPSWIAPTVNALVSDPASASYPFVAALSTEWGVDLAPDGRTVWFEMLQFGVADVLV